MKKSNFFAFIFRMKYINRWALMKNTRYENVTEHSLEVSVIAHALALIQKNKLGNNKINPEKVAVYAIYHDTSEIITGDLPTPVKYFNKSINLAYKDLEDRASKSILKMLPDYLINDYENIFIAKEADKEIWDTVKAADKISAYLKCIDEENSGNKEFHNAKETIINTLKEMNRKDVEIFLEEFIHGFNLTLDEVGIDIRQN
ncbi:MAG TPA: 5'-deoxynucleotidase [Clostridiales bacterium]|nr:5'-deoxynucleotidase [Clostridiales bacterium]